MRLTNDQLNEYGCKEITSTFNTSIRSLCEEYDIHIFLCEDRKKLTTLDTEFDGIRLAFTSIVRRCIIYKYIILMEDDITNGSFTADDVEVMIWHELGHIVKDTSDEEIADDYAIEHTTDEALIHCLNMIRLYLIRINEWHGWTGKYIHRNYLVNRYINNTMISMFNKMVPKHLFS